MGGNVMRKLIVFILSGLIITSLIFIRGAEAVTVDEIGAIIIEYPDGYFTNANAGIKDSFVISLESIASNIDLFNEETDTAFKAELGQEVHKELEALIFRTDGCVSSGSNPDVDDWLVDCQSQNEIYLKLEELLANY
jgi:hypothetical protein